ncbi:MAG: TauD/TfdA family dioxygenase [Proteobacteria bacterium]|nr:TauD/TfdA family dioxygenase [Pseudomonadota bacterium]
MNPSLSVTPTGQATGAIVTGVDLAEGLDADAIVAIRQAWLDHQVLVFPDQPITHDQLEAFTLAFGAFGYDPFIEAMPDHPHILELRREPDEKVPNFGSSWHSDWSFQDAPPSATILHSKIVPPVGGDTLYADSNAAYDTLPEETKERIADLRGIHSARMPYSKQGIYAQDGDKRAMSFKVSDNALAERTHPMVRTHPETGRKALYINMVYTIGIEGMDDDEARALLHPLFKHAVEDWFIYRHKWQPNMLAMWDNRCLQHLADGGYDGHLRVMHRSTVAGDIPV